MLYKVKVINNRQIYIVPFIRNTKVDRQRLEEILTIENHWRLTNKVKKEKTGDFERSILPEIYRKTIGENIVSIIGPRRTEKRYCYIN